MEIKLTREELLTLMRDLPASHWLQKRLQKELSEHPADLRDYVRPKTQKEHWDDMRQGLTSY